MHPAPDHPGCIYGEMGKCLAPCNRAQIPANAQAYAAEAAAVEAFLNTRGESLVTKLTAEREQASADLNFERAAEIHAQIQKVKAAVALADELVAPIPHLRAIIVQKAATNEAADTEEPTAAVYLLHAGCLFGPARLSTLGVRAVREQTAVGSSLFAQPLMLEAIPLTEESGPASTGTEPGAPFMERSDMSGNTLNPEARAEAAIATLEARAAGSSTPDLATLSDHLSLLRRWYYRPEKQRAGEIFFPKAEGSFPRSSGSWPVRRILRAAARAALAEPALLPEIRRDLAQKNPGPTLSDAPST